MLFNFGSRKEVVAHSQLMPYLNRCFNSSISQFDSRCKSIESRIEDLLKRFIDICDRFEISEESPEKDMEYITARVSQEVIESQKRLYIKAIREIVSDKGDGSYENYYETHEHALKDISAKLESLSKNNNTFRHVFLSYPKHMNSFKDAFGQIDREVARLKSELERNSDSYKRYRHLRDRIEDLTTKRYRREEIREEIGDIKERMSGYGEAGHAEEDISRRADESKSRKTELERDLSKSIKSISSMLLPLERPARKYDYIVGKRGTLYKMVTDPIGTITDEESYGVFRYNLLSMQDAINKGEIEVKNRMDVNSEISKILESNILESLIRVRDIRREIESIDMAYRAAKRDMEAAHIKKRGRIEMEERMGRLEIELDQIERQIETLKAEIVESFIKNYGKNIEIDLRDI